MWKCEKCSITNEDRFDSCWKCGTGKDGSAPPADFAERAEDFAEKSRENQASIKSNDGMLSVIKLIGKVVLVFVVWVALGVLLQVVGPEVHEKYGMGTSSMDADKIASLQHRYSGIVSNLSVMGFRKEDEITVAAKRETRFTGTYGNISDVQIDVSLGKSPSSETTRLRIWAKYTHPRWKDGRGADHRILKDKLDSMMRE